VTIARSSFLFALAVSGLACAPVPPRHATTAGDITPFARQVLAGQLCERIGGRFLATSANGSSGTLYVERCSAGLTPQGEVDVGLGGFGWDGGALQVPHVVFQRPLAVDVELSARLRTRAWYTPHERLVTLHILPSSEVKAHMQGAGQIDAGPGTLAGDLVHLGSPIPARVDQFLRSEASAMLAAKLREGATLEVSVLTRQHQSGLGQWAAGQRRPPPVPPLGDPRSSTWLVNEQLSIRGHGMLMRGPFAPARAAVVRTRLAEGAVRVAAICAADARASASSLRVSHAAFEQAIGPFAAQVASTASAPGSPDALLALPPCEWVALLWSETPAVRGGVMLATP